LDSLFIVRFDHSGLLPQSSGKRGGGAGSHFKSPVCGGGGGRKEGGRKQKVIPGLSGLQGRARQFTPGQTGLSIILCRGKTTFKPGSIPAIQELINASGKKLSLWSFLNHNNLSLRERELSLYVICWKKYEEDVI
jgi:hypothetical protein